MPDAFRVADHLKAADLRQINMEEWREGPDSYFGSTPEWTLTESEVMRGMARPGDDELQAVIQEVPEYPTTPQGIRSAWAHHMAVHSGYHAWPNANHRTAMRSFNLALGRAENLNVGFENLATGAELVAAARRNATWMKACTPWLNSKTKRTRTAHCFAPSCLAS